MAEFSESDQRWMQYAIKLAKTAAKQAEVPVGAVLVLQDTIIGEGFNCPISTCDATAHAEIIALRQGAKQLKNYRLLETTLYVTLEPCLMCVGALVHARVKRVVFGAYDLKKGAVLASEFNQVNHKIVYQGGLFAEQCGDVLTQFFLAKREKVDLKIDD